MNEAKQHERGARTYRSELRQEQAEATRVRILEAVYSLLKGGDRELAYASVAREARVSVPTVYRHFPTRQDLFEGFFRWSEDRRDTGGEAWAAGDFGGSVRAFFARLDDPDGAFARASRLNALFEFSRAVTVPRRRAAFEALVDGRAPRLGEPDRTRIVDLGVVLLSSAMAEAMRGYLDRSGAETADRVVVGIEALLQYAEAHQPPESP